MYNFRYVTYLNLLNFSENRAKKRFLYFLHKPLRNKVPLVPRMPKRPSAQVPKCSSRTRVPKCLSAQEPKSPRALSARVPKCPSSARVPRVPKCPSALRVPWSALLVAKFHFEWSSSKKVWNITRNGLANNFIEFK